jgi:hypothetical protein
MVKNLLNNQNRKVLAKHKKREKVNNMADDIPDYMRGFDLNEDWGITPVSNPPKIHNLQLTLAS